MQRINKRIYNSSFFREFICPGKAGEQIQITGVSGSLRSIFVAFLVEKLEKWVVFVTSDLDSAERLHDDLSLLLDKTKVSFFPPAEAAPYEDQDANPSLVRLRLEAQLNLLNNDSGVVVATHQGLLQYMQTPEDFVDHQFHINKSKEYPFEDLISGLVTAGYERCDVVEDVGHLAVRGGIIDIYPWTNDDPVRIEFFGNEVESIRTFNVVSQRSIEEIDQISILPRQEGDQLVSLFEYLDNKAVFAIEDYAIIKEKSKEYHEQIADSYERQLQSNVFPAKPDEKYLSLKELQDSMENFPHIRFDLVQNTDIPVYHIDSTAPPTFAGHLGRFFSYLKKQASKQNTVFIQCDSRPQEERLSEILEDEGLEGLANIMVGALHNGFIFNEENLHVITDHELYDRFKKRRTYKRFRNGEYLRSLNAMNVNDYIVHIDYGVGQYKGLETIDSGTSRRECIKVVYEDGDSLFVSVDRLNRVQKYASDEDLTPKLTRLGSGEWERLKKRTKESIQKIAAELIQINAARKFHKGHAFSTDTHWQKELEASFPYEETQDQSRSIYEVKKDLENETPMDRLLCGDVGYGKTEVALRAAFKAVMDGRQVALLVPTTILAHQHYQTFRERINEFPVNIEMLSRFRTAKQQREVIQKLADGAIDIIIGTHRLFSEDVKFKNLGLLVIDEEQRFGVKHKEKLKKMRVMVDVLTMSATPIPRTLHLSLMGARDLSHIETPPRNRLPVITEIHEWDDELIRNAVNRELERGGQVYFVHNRVNTIDGVRRIINDILPHAKIAVAHGQLPEKQLEMIMMDFINRKYDVLISTMIIENGLDIPNVNTIIIDHAQRFGLSQLYQLRGRVGRSSEQAYAYLIIHSTIRLTGLAQKRLRAIQDFTDLGSGFKVALRDMEIRGIGNILGKEQSGNIQAVGFDLYCKLLEESVASIKNQTELAETDIVHDRYTDPKLDVDFDLIIPHDYIYSEVERITIYHRMVNFRNLDDLEKMKSELKDRFGPVPESIIRLIDAIELKILAGKIYASRIALKGNMMRIDFAEQAKEDDYFFKDILPALMNAKKSNVRFIGDADKLGVQLQLHGSDKNEQISFAKNILNSIN
jgi:transcription-repair coupling factor (superfamily II helicase)